jgi:hypothetical protein
MLMLLLLLMLARRCLAHVRAAAHAVLRQAHEPARGCAHGVTGLVHHASPGQLALGCLHGLQSCVSWGGGLFWGAGPTHAHMNSPTSTLVARAAWHQVFVVHTPTHTHTRTHT